MNLLHIFILSIVEGLTEFLPISSTGHLILMSKLLGIAETNFVKTFEIVIQLGAIMAVVVLYTKKFLSINILKKLAIAFFPTGIIALTLYPVIKSFLLGNSSVTLYALFLGGVALIAIEWLLKNSKLKTQNSKLTVVNINTINYKQAFLIGCFQCLSVIPGVSRAASTIVGGLVTGLNRPTAAEFSFLLAVPTMVAATGYDLFKSRDLISQGGFLTLFIGTVLSFIFAMLAVKFLIGFVKKHNFTIFGVYRIILAILFWIFVV